MQSWCEQFLGNWSGSNLLHLSWPTLADHKSISNMQVLPMGNGKGLRIDYDWSHEGQTQQGTLLVAWHAEQCVATAAWFDSWHQDKKIMYCSGEFDSSGTLRLIGSFEAPPDRDWGWRISFKPGPDSLQMRMDVIPPDGKEELAVLADYKRAV